MSLGGGPGGGGGELQQVSQQIQEVEQGIEAVEAEIESVREEKSDIDEAIDAIQGLETGSCYFDKLWKLQKPGKLRENKYDLAGYIGVSPYFVEEYKQAAQRYDRTAIADAYSALVAADYELKGGASRDASVIVTLLLRRLLPPEARPVVA